MCVLTDEERALLTERLAQAEAAYHALMTGTQARVIVDQNGERVEYGTSNRSNLYAYIQWLRLQLGLLTPSCGMPSGPATFYF